MCLAVNVSVQTSSQSFPMDIRSPGCMWGEMWDVLSLVASNGLGLSSALCVACMMLQYGSKTWGPLEILTLFVHGIFTLM